MSVRNITEYKKDAVLRKKANYVKKVNRETIALIRDMADMMYQANGVGLAAPQLGITKRVITIDIGSGLISLINPKIMEQKGNQTDIEGCLSIPGILGEVIRPDWVRVRGLNENGEQVELEARDCWRVLFAMKLTISTVFCLLISSYPEQLRK